VPCYTGAVNALLRRIDAVNRAHPWSHNDHYLPWVLRQVPPGATRALDVGCGTGTLLRALASRVPAVDGIDRDPAMAAAAGARHADLFDLPPEPAYDLVTAVAVLHHLPLRPALTHLRALLNPRGRLVIVGCYQQSTLADRTVDLVAVPANLVVGLLKTGQADAARHAMSSPTTPARETLQEVRAAIPGAHVRRRLFWRYTAVVDAG
jgi:trans-aconitate methyltransferase